uniref:Integrase_H2C2 domain-containing protein n=1 Tax=Strongyloides stercoralis TaxID=6248 RepID=A0A0K0ETN9_STRER
MIKFNDPSIFNNIPLHIDVVSLPSIPNNDVQKCRGRPPKSKFIPNDIIDVNEPSLKNFSNFSKNKGVDSDDLNLHELFKVAHSNGHPGLDKMVELIQLRLPKVENLCSKIAIYLSTCLTCKLINSGMKRVLPPKFINQYDCPGQCYFMDIMGKIKPSSNNGDCYVVRGNSQCESSFKTVSDIIAKICKRLPTTWEDALEVAQFFVNSTVSKSTGVSPFYAEYLRKPNTLLDQMLKTYSSGIHNTSKNLFDLYTNSAIIRKKNLSMFKRNLYR